MGDCYNHGGSWRILGKELCKVFSRETGCALVEGFASLLDQGDCMEDASSCFDSNFNRLRTPQYFCSLSSKKEIEIKTGRIRTGGCDKIAFLLNTGFGNGHPLPQPSGRWDIYVNEKRVVSVRVVKHSFIWVNKNCSFIFSAGRIITARPYESIYLNDSIRCDSFAAFGSALLVVPIDIVQPDQEAKITVKAHCEDKSTRWMSFRQSGPVDANSEEPEIGFTNIYKLVDMINGNNKLKSDRYYTYFGDLHTHSGETHGISKTGCGYGSRIANYEYAKGPGGLDFYALTDHERQIGDSQDERSYFGLADTYNEAGRFVCIPGYEHTNKFYGHRNVYFINSRGTIVTASKTDQLPNRDPADALPPEDLHQKLIKQDIKFFTVPHHSSAVDHPFNIYRIYPEHDRLIEVYSCWGSSEYYGDFPRGIPERYEGFSVRDVLNKGDKLGIIASSDGHDGHPGAGQSFSFKHQHIYHFLGSGYVAVLAERLTRDVVFQALYARRCYGTTGVPIRLNFSINGYIMGSILPALNDRPVLRIICSGTNGIDHIRIIKNGKVVETIFGHGEFLIDSEWEDKEYDMNISNYYYVRIVQQDRESAWASPIWIG